MNRLIRMTILMMLTIVLSVGLNAGFPPLMHRVLAQSNPCSSPANAIVAENCKTGNPSSEWDISGIGDPNIQGFATDISVNRGDTISFKIKTSAPNYRLDIYRMGYYGGNGARKVVTVQPSSTQAQQARNQPNCLTNTTTGLIDCGNWAVSASWNVPANATSGIYFAKAVRSDNGEASHIVFIVRDDASNSALLFQTSDTTWQAYNDYGGNSLYVGSPAGRAYKVSYNRPFRTRIVDNGQDWLFNAEYPMVRWLEANGYDVSYFTGVDSDRRGNLIRNHKVFLSVGHDEYWSNAQRTNVETARNQGTHLAFFSGNEIFWKTRWENSIDSSATPYRTLVTYKETKANAKIDPQPNIWTGTWRDPRFSPPADGGRPENALSGTIFEVNGGTRAIQVPAADGKMRFWRNTNIANLASGSTATLTDGTLGYEWDEDLDNGFRPPGLIRMSSTTANNVEILQDYGSTYAIGTATHHLTLYKHSSGALVFGSGTIQWPWGLDSNHDRSNPPADPRMQQATVNLFADMGVQPATLQTGLFAATASGDTTRPTSTITSPTATTTVQSGGQVTITGTATDSGGGVVGGVEVSVDGGTTWHPANGRANWTYTWRAGTSGSVTIKSRAVDDSGNIEIPGAGVTLTIGARTCPCSIWDNATTPTVTADPSTDAIEVGVRFRSDRNGYISGIRFYKGTGNTGTHVGTLWSSSGTQLARATFTNETASGWQQVNFDSPVAITANTVYVASYHTNVGRYAYDNRYFANSGVDNPPLYALRDGVSGGNGVYAESSTPVFPTLSFQSSNYWVDVVFTTTAPSDTTPPTVSAITPSSGATNVSVGSSVTATFSEAMSAATVNNDTFQLRGSNSTVVSATVTYDAANRTATLTPGSSLAPNTTYTATVRGGSTDPRVKDQAGNALAASLNWSFTTAAADTTPPTVTAITPSNNATGVSTGGSITATFSEAMSAATVNSNTFELRGPGNALVSANVTYNTANRTATLTPTSPLAVSTTYNAIVKGGSTDPRVKDLAGNALATNFTWSFTTGAGASSIWNNTITPTVLADPDTDAVELGVKFRSDVNGLITGIRFYKSTSNTGTHVGTLWSNTGTQLARVTFANETASGWQQANFTTPVAITANTTYVASYHTNVGRYSVDEDYFTNAGVNSPPLEALRNGVSGGNGVYKYSSTPVFPNETHKSSNYWVDIVFAPN